MGTGTPPTPTLTCRKEAGAGSYDPTMTENTEYMSRAINLLYLFRYQIWGGMAVLKVMVFPSLVVLSNQTGSTNFSRATVAVGDVGRQDHRHPTLSAQQLNE